MKVFPLTRTALVCRDRKCLPRTESRWARWRSPASGNTWGPAGSPLCLPGGHYAASERYNYDFSFPILVPTSSTPVLEMLSIKVDSEYEMAKIKKHLFKLGFLKSKFTWKQSSKSPSPSPLLSVLAGKKCWPQPPQLFEVEQQKFEELEFI